MSRRLVFALILAPGTKLISGSDLFHLCDPLRQNARHCATAWGHAAPDVVVLKSEDKMPDFCSPIVFTDRDGDPGSLAVHFYDPYRRSPGAIVYVDRASGLREGEDSICESASHEVVEADCNPDLSVWREHPTRPGVQVAQETADPLQTTYEVQSRGAAWPVANFVYPAWFLPGPHTTETFFDFAGQLTRPGEVGPSGYVILREREGDGWRRWFESRTENFGSVSPKKKQSTGRTALLQGRP